MIRRTLMFAAMALAMQGAVAKDWDSIRFATEGAYPPFNTVDTSGAVQGFDVDVANALCEEMKAKCTWVKQEWDGMIPALLSRKFDAISASMSITEERMQTIDFSDKYYDTPTVVIGPKGVDMAPTPEGLAGKIIGVQVATVHEAYAQKHFATTAAEVKIYQTQDEANQDLVAGRIDATQADSIALDTFLATAEGAACCESKGAVADDPEVLGLGVGVGLRKGEDDLKAKFNAGIAKVLADGTYEAISKPYFASSIYGG